jgi:hypothetical protein
MNITLLSIPATVIQVSPEILSYWLATESANNFELQRRDWLITASGESTGSPANCMEFTLDAEFTGAIGDVIAVYNNYNQSMNVGHITDIISGSPELIVTTDIPYVATFDGAYLNDHTLYNGFYFEGRLTVNDVLQTLTIIASPNSFGIANLDVSGILRIMTTLGKTGDYTDLIMAETNKSGKFTFEYRPCWYGSDTAWIAEGNTWYYAECIRSVEQGSNLEEFVASEAGDAPFLNSFPQPVYFDGLPFDISFICPDMDEISPAAVLRIIISRYDASNNLLASTVTDVDPTGLVGRVCSLTIDPDAIENNAAYITAQIEIATP